MDPRHEKFVPEDLRDIITRLKDWAQEQRLTDRATEACRADLRRCVDQRWEGGERLEGRDLDGVTMQFIRSSLMFQHGGWASPAVRAEFMLYHTPRGSDGPFGSYSFSVRLDGYSVGGHLIVFTTEPTAA